MPNLTHSQILAVSTLLAAKALVATIKPIVLGYQTKILNEGNFLNTHDNTKIVNPLLSYCMSDEDFLIYLNLVDIEMEKAGLSVENAGECPLLVAEHNEIKAKWLVFAEYKPIHNLESQPCKVEDFNKVIDLTISLCLAYCREKNIDIKALAMPSN